MREKSSECPTHVEYVRGTTEMCSRDPPALHPALAKANGKNSSPQASPRGDRAIDREANCLPTPGGRLKFFKDGKFILELSHRRDGERTTWFPVPKKTFWPPASTTPNRQESSTSLSVSDDNSSIQSSPWQRDHCWKQSHPRRCVTTEFNFYYHRDPRNGLSTPPRQLSRIRRRPLDPWPLPLLTETPTRPQKPPTKSNNVTPGKALTLIIDKLSRLDPNVVSPRKRILRELERVTLEDQASKRRVTPQPIAPTTTPPVQSQKQLSSYSITSILGEDKPSPEPGFLRNLLKLEDNAVKYSSSHSYPRGRIDPFVASANTSIHHPIYGVPMLPPGPYRAPGLWMHYPPPVHYPPPIPIYPPPPPPHPSSPPVHHYKDYREQTLTPPSDVPLNLSKHAG
ncbi:pollen-specific leucine-rich repeat extensin-like protein 1 [Fopius arisanus]|uniref:Pollen-specific leucine-rich repeat extensin-like protein 1 n=1 Tax=Fopius arisanus TaxID=64838 RepID=A0A9R1T2Z8_9HYME|nr:PREDICTED: pollen-specific leucine-rich repeat extensin-like protein 1 [Fopius arisanus]